MKVTLPTAGADRSLSPRLGVYAATRQASGAGYWSPQMMFGRPGGCNPGCICLNPYGCPCCMGRGTEDPVPPNGMTPWSW